MKARLGLILLLVAALVVVGVGCKTTGGGWFIDKETDHRVSLGFTAIAIGDPWLEYNTVVVDGEEIEVLWIVWPAKGQFQLVDHTSKEKIHGTFEVVFWEEPLDAPPHMLGSYRAADGPCWIDGVRYHLHVETTDNGEPGVKDRVSIEIFKKDTMWKYWHGTLERGNIQVHKK